MESKISMKNLISATAFIALIMFFAQPFAYGQGCGGPGYGGGMPGDGSGYEDMPGYDDGPGDGGMPGDGSGYGHMPGYDDDPGDVDMPGYDDGPGYGHMPGHGPGYGHMPGHGGGYWYSDNSLVSESVEKDLPMNSIDRMWNDIEGINVSVMPMMAYNLMGRWNMVELKSVHTASDLYVYARWWDSAPSVYKKMWVKTSDGWQQSSEDEDRLAFIWNIDDSIPWFDYKGYGHHSGMGGCALLCHIDPEDYTKLKMSTKYVGGTADVWHWKSARTNPVGFSDDQFMDTEKRKNDNGTSAYKDNKLEDGDTPAFMSSGGPGKSAFLLEADAVAFDDALFAEGDTVPAYVLRIPAGDRADLQAYGVWADGYWTVVLKRSLKTGSATDVQFADTGDVYPFSLSVFNNAGDEDHLKSGVIYMSFQ